MMIVQHLRVYDNVVLAIQDAKRSDIRAAKRIFIKRYGKENFEQHIAPHRMHLQTIFNEPPNVFTRAFVDEVAAMVDVRAFKKMKQEQEDLIKELDEMAKSPLVVTEDPTMPEDEAVIRGANGSEVRVVNLGTEDKSDG